MYYNGFELLESRALTIGFTNIPKRKHKNKRIQKKWNKKYGYWYFPIPDPQLYFFDNKFFGHPKTIKKIMKLIEKEKIRKESIIWNYGK